MKKLLILFIFCFHLQAQELDTGVDVIYLDSTSLWTIDVFLHDVDNPDAVPIQFTDVFAMGQCLDRNYDNPDGAEECRLLDSPPYLGIWELQYENPYFIFENMETGERITLYRCVNVCYYELSPDGRWLILDDYRLLDLSRFEQTTAIYISHGYLEKLFWLDARHLLYWQSDFARFFLYDTETSLNYFFEDVLDRETLSINTDGVEGFAVMPDIPPLDESNVPIDIQRYSSDWALRPDSSGVIYVSSDYEVPQGEYCDNCAVAYWDMEAESSEILFGLDAELENGFRRAWYLLSLHWSTDGSQFIAGFSHLSISHEPTYYWLYDMETAELRESFAGLYWVQWLR